MTTARCGCCTRPVAARDLLCATCWPLVPVDERRAFLRAASRAGRHYGTVGWRQIPEAKAAIAAVKDKLTQRAAQTRANAPELF